MLYKCNKYLGYKGDLLLLPDVVITEEDYINNNLCIDGFTCVSSDVDIKTVGCCNFLKEDFDKKVIIEVDVDGVVLNIHQHLNNYVRDLYPDFDGDKHIESWGMEELNKLHKDLRGRCLSLFNSPEFMTTIPFFDNAIDSLKVLDSFQQQYSNVLVVLNTHCFNSDIVMSRYKQLSKILRDENIGIPLFCNSGTEKKMLNSSCCIEDCYLNLKRSNALYKFLVARGHNRHVKYEDMGHCYVLYFGGQLSSYVGIVEDLLKRRVLFDD